MAEIDDKVVARLLADPFADQQIAAEMRAVVGVRYVCATAGCDWWGYSFVPEELCPRCGHMPIDRWAEHARAVRDYDKQGWIG